MGVSDVDALHNSLTRDQLDEWRAIAIIDGWYHGRAQEAEILAAIHNGFNRLICFNADNPARASETIDWKSGADFVKDFSTFGRKQKKNGQMMTAKQYQQHLEAKYGNHD